MRVKTILGDILISGIIGIVFAMLIKRMNDLNIIVDVYVTASTPIEEIMLGIILIWVFFGIIYGSVKRR